MWQYMETVNTLHQLPPFHKIPALPVGKGFQGTYIWKEEEGIFDCHLQPAGDKHELAFGWLCPAVQIT